MTSKAKILIILLTALLLAVIYGEFRTFQRTRKAGLWKDQELAALQGDTLYSTVYLPAYAGSRVGYHYELMKKFARAHKMVLQYAPAHDSVPAWDLLENNITDILAINIIRDSIPKHLTGKLFITPQITSMGEVWVVLKDKHPWHLNMVHWLTLFKQSQGYAKFRSRFFPASIDRCPYDSLLRVYGRTLMGLAITPICHVPGISIQNECTFFRKCHRPHANQRSYRCRYENQRPIQPGR